VLVIVLDRLKNEEFDHEHEQEHDYEKKQFRNREGVDLAIHSFPSVELGFSLAFALRN
jgi:hypothetical protein